MQVDPMQPKLKPPGTERLKLKCDIMLTKPALKFNMRHYAEVVIKPSGCALVGRSRLTLSNPR